METTICTVYDVLYCDRRVLFGCKMNCWQNVCVKWGGNADKLTAELSGGLRRGNSKSKVKLLEELGTLE